MKRVLALVLVLLMSVALVACGGEEGLSKQDAIDAFNASSTVLGEVSQAINADIESYEEALVDELIGYAGEMQAFKDSLEGTEELTEEQLTEIIDRSGEIKARAEELKTELGL